jgi:hypothetical protein
MVKLALCIFGAAVFAEPAVTKVEEMVGLIHRQMTGDESGAGVSHAKAF